MRLPIRDQSTVGLERLNSKQFDQFREFIYANSGIHIGPNKVTLLSNRVRRRVSAGGFKDFDSYFRFLTSREGRDELSGFLDAITTNETFFFRTKRHFEWLVGDWLAEQIARHRSGQRDTQLRVWSAGCSSGAEPYSIAISLAENLFRLRGWSLDILGTDLSEEILDEARAGIYRPRAMDAVSERQRRRYFRHKTEGDLWEVEPAVKKMVHFKQHNLMRPIGQPSFDCIFICNVLIYFDLKSKQTVIDHLLNSLADGGYLVVGPSEGVYEMLQGLRRVSPLIYQKVSSDSHVEKSNQKRGDSR
jgi:chemotaxis protein methyltransferase CheR